MGTKGKHETQEQFEASIPADKSGDQRYQIIAELRLSKLTEKLLEDISADTSSEMREKTLVEKLFENLTEKNKNKDNIKNRKSFFYSWPGTRTGKDMWGNITTLWWGWGNRTTNWHARVKRALTNQMAEEEAAATKIQSLYRGFFVRKSKELADANKLAETKLQENKQAKEGAANERAKPAETQLQLQEEAKESAKAKKGMSKIEKFMQDADTVAEITDKLTEIITNQANLLKPNSDEYDKAKNFIAIITGYSQSSIEAVIDGWHKAFANVTTVPSPLTGKLNTPALTGEDDLTSLVTKAEIKAIEDIPKILESIINSKSSIETEYPYDIFVSQLSNKLKGVYTDISDPTERSKRRGNLRDTFKILSACSVLKSGHYYDKMKNYAKKNSIDIISKSENSSNISSTSTIEAPPKRILKNCTDIGKILKQKANDLSEEEKGELERKVPDAARSTSIEDDRPIRAKTQACPLTPIQAFHGDEEQTTPLHSSKKVGFSGASTKLRTVGIFPGISEKEKTQSHELDAANTEPGILVEA
jgi:hypothetical protein